MRSDTPKQTTDSGFEFDMGPRERFWTGSILALERLDSALMPTEWTLTSSAEPCSPVVSIQRPLRIFLVAPSLHSH